MNYLFINREYFFSFGCVHPHHYNVYMVKTHFCFLIIIYTKSLAAEVYRKMNWLTRFFCPWTIVLLILCVGEENTICSTKNCCLHGYMIAQGA